MTGIQESCTIAVLEVNSRCCPGACLSVPESCASTECAETFLPFYRECGKVLQALDATMPTAGFAALYESCVAEQGHTGARTGKLVDDSVESNALYDFSAAATVAALCATASSSCNVARLVMACSFAVSCAPTSRTA